MIYLRQSFKVNLNRSNTPNKTSHKDFTYLKLVSKFRISYRGPYLWNVLKNNEETKILASPQAFKNKMKHKLFLSTK